MINKLSGSAGVNENKESVKADKISRYLDQMFNPYSEPNGIFLYDWGDPTTENNGAYLFSKVVNSPAYKKFAEKEIALYLENAESVKSSFAQKKATNIVDMGPGDGEKSARILSEVLGDDLYGKTYIPVDISPYFVQHAGGNVQHTIYTKNKMRIHAAGVNIDFLESNAGLKDMKNKLYMFLGSSIGNFSDSQIVSILRNMAADDSKKNNIIMSFFTAPDKTDENYADTIQQMCAAYGDPDTNNPHFDQETHETIKSWVISGFGSLGIDTSKLEFFVRYDEVNTKMVLGAKVKETITVKHNGRIYTKEAGDELLAIQSKRFTPSTLSNLCEKAGVTISKIKSHEGVGIAFMESDITYEAKEKKRNQKKWKVRSAIAGVLLAAGVKGGMEIQKHSQNENIKQNLENIMRNKLEPKSFAYEFYGNLSDNEKSEYFTKKADEFYSVLADRYDLANFSDAKQLFVKMLLNQWLLNQDESVIDITSSSHHQGMGNNHTHEKICELLEVFIDNNTYMLTSNDISLKLHENFIEYEKAFSNTLENKSVISHPQFTTTTQPRGGGVTSRSGYDWIGPYTTLDGDTYLAALYEKDGKEVIIGCHLSIPSGEDKEEWIKNYKNQSLYTLRMNRDQYPALTSEIGKIIAEDYFKKPYFHSLAEKILNSIKDDQNATPYDVGHIISSLTYRSKEGYDFAWLAQTKDERHIKYFSHTFLPYLFKSESTEFNKVPQIRSIMEVSVDYLGTTMIEMNTFIERNRLENEIFHRLCIQSPSKEDKKGIERWIDENEDIFKPFYSDHPLPRLNVQNKSIISDIQPYKKSSVTDIKHGPGMINISLSSYKALDGKEYEVGVVDGVFYARYIGERDKDGKIPFIENIVARIIEDCKKQGIGPWNKEVIERAKDWGGHAQITLADSRSRFTDDIRSKIYGYNSEVGNIVLEDCRKRREY